jgi:hypothetical protein
MQPERRRQIVLAVLVVVLAILLYRAWPRSAGPAPAASNPRGAARAGQSAAAAPDVKLEALEDERPKPEGATRNLFRFGRAPGTTAAAPPSAPVEQPPVQRPTTPMAPTVPPIPLKFVGTMQVGGKMMAVLSDASGQQRDPVYGFEGDTILGQYRLVRVSAESVEMSYLDGRGRQTIRFSGS